MKLELRYPATPESALDHAQLAVQMARQEFEVRLDYSPHSLEDVDNQIESLRDEGLTGEDAAEVLFVLGCYLGQVMARHLKGRWVATARSPLAEISPWPMVIVLPGGSAWVPSARPTSGSNWATRSTCPPFSKPRPPARHREEDEGRGRSRACRRS